MLKVLHYTPFISKSLGGVPAFMHLLTRDLGKLCELHIITHQYPDDYKLENCTVHYIPKWKPWASGKKEFIQLLHDINPDIFHANACWLPLCAYSAIWAKKEGFKVVYTPHGELAPRAIQHHHLKKKPAIYLYQKRGVKAADLIHVTSDDDEKNQIKLGWNTRCYQVPNCIHIDQIPLKKTWTINKKLLFLSRVKQSKGIHHIIEAVSILKNELQGYKFYIAGPKENSYYDEMVKMASDYKVSDIVEFTGPIYGDTKIRLLHEADVFVLPTYTENFGIVVAEALACGTPVITTNGAPWKALQTNQCGWWTEIGTQPLVEAIKSFLTCSEEDLKEMGKRGRQLVENKYTSESVAKQFIEMYKSLL